MKITSLTFLDAPAVLYPKIQHCLIVLLLKTSSNPVKISILNCLEKLTKLKSGETWERVQNGVDPPAKGLGTFFELGTFLKRVDPLK